MGKHQTTCEPGERNRNVQVNRWFEQREIQVFSGKKKEQRSLQCDVIGEYVPVLRACYSTTAGRGGKLLCLIGETLWRKWLVRRQGAGRLREIKLLRNGETDVLSMEGTVKCRNGIMVQCYSLKETQAARKRGVWSRCRGEELHEEEDWDIKLLRNDEADPLSMADTVKVGTE